jgi:hypothetical protein
MVSGVLGWGLLSAPASATWTATDGVGGVDTTAKLTSRGWGTDIQLRLKDLQPYEHCMLVVHGRDGATETAGWWAVNGSHQAQTVVGWTVQATDLDVWIRGFGTDGTDTGRLSSQQLSSATAGRQEQMSVAVSPYAEVAVAYTDDNDGNTYDQVILGTGISNNSW